MFRKNQNRLVLATSVVVLAGLSASLPMAIDPTATDDGLTSQQRETMLDLAIIATVLDARRKRRGAFTEHASFVTMRRFTAELDRTYAERLPHSDGWGRDLLVATAQEDYLIVSRGEDGLLDEESGDVGAALKRKHSEWRTQETTGDDLVLRSGNMVRRPVTATDRQRRTMADMRSIATTVEEYAIDNEAYPGPTGGVVAVDYLIPFVEEVYIRRLPVTDGWGHPLLFWSDGARYAVACSGADGVFQIDDWRPVKTKWPLGGVNSSTEFARTKSRSNRA